jgi:hypothetical protein
MKEHERKRCEVKDRCTEEYASQKHGSKEPHVVGVMSGY